MVDVVFDGLVGKAKLSPGIYRLSTDGNVEQPWGGPIAGTEFTVPEPAAAPVGGTPGDKGPVGDKGPIGDKGPAGDAGVSAPYVSTPPDFATTVAEIGSGKFIDWTWGNVELAAPALANMTAVCNGAGLDMHGALIIPATGFPVGADGLTFICPTTNAVNTVVRGLALRNFTIAGFPGNNLVLSSPLGSSCIRGAQISGVVTLGAGKSGLLMSGGVFECDTWGIVSGSNGLHGVEFHQPAFGPNAGIMSSQNVWGGTIHDNGKAGIANTADIAYQEAQGTYIYGTNLINNKWPGYMGTGLALALGVHAEANCQGADTPSRGGIYCYGGAAKIETCDGADSAGKQMYLADIGSANSAQLTIIKGSSMVIEGGAQVAKLVRLFGAGTLRVDRVLTPADFDSNGAWTIVEPTSTTRTA